MIISTSKYQEQMAGPENQAMLWDLPVRLFHWGLVVSILSCWITIDQGWMDAHLISGVIVLILVLFRIVWGLIGSSTALFKSFLVQPWIAALYLKKSLGNEHQFHGGHNPAGGYMVICMLLVILLQVSTGLFSNNDLGFGGPFSDHISKDSSDSATIIHGWTFDIILAVVWLHVVAVFYYVLVKQDNLVKPMITGRKQLEQLPQNHQFFDRSYYYALATLVIVSAGVVYSL